MDGSSMSRMRGRAMRARPVANICCSPPESVPRNLRPPFLQSREQHEDTLQVG